MYIPFVLILYIVAFLYLGYSDYKYHTIPNRVLLPSMTIIAILNCFLMPVGWINTLIGGGIALGLSLPFVLLAKAPGGDFKFIIFAGIAAGYPAVLFAIPGSTILAALTGIILVYILKKKKTADKLPFGVFLGIGTSITIALSYYLYY